MKKVYLLSDGDWLQEIATTKKELRSLFFSNASSRRSGLKAKEYNVRLIEYNGKKYDYDWWYWDFFVFEKWKELEDYIEYDDYDKYEIKQKELKKDFLYLKNK